MRESEQMEHHIRRLCGRAIGDFGLIQNHDRILVALSGGKDSAALAIYMRDHVPEMEYIFHDTDKELPETYEYLHKLEAYLGKEGQYA